MKKLIYYAIHRRGLALVAFVLVACVGYYSWTQLAIDAYPDIADTTVQVVTQVPGLAAEEIEQQISVPVERALNGLPGLNVMRSKNTFGLSTVVLVFDDDVDDYWARQRVQERLTEVELPYGAAPELNPLTSPTGEIFRYVLTSDSLDRRQLTDLHKWVVIPRLKQVTGVADVSNFGGVTTQYQIELDPAKLLSLGAIDFGIIVDGAIVMMETILKRRERYPTEPLSEQAVVRRAGVVAKPIFFSALIIITAYLPIFAFEHIERKLFTPMAYTVGYALLGALAVALLLIPGLAFVAYRRPRKSYHNKWLERMTLAYNAQVKRVLERPKRIILPMAGILVAACVLCGTVGKDFLPTLDEGAIWVQVQLPSGISIEQSKQMGREIRHRLGEFDEVSYVMTQVGRDDEGAEAFSLSHVECGVGLKPYGTWKGGKTKDDLIAEMSAALAGIPGIEVSFSQPIMDMVMDLLAGAHSDLALKVYGDDLDSTRAVAGRAVAELKRIPGAADVAIDQEPPMPQLQIIADREKIAQYGVNVKDVADMIELAIGGRAVSQIFVGSKSYDVICRFSERTRATAEDIGSLLLRSESGKPVPLSQVATIRMTTGASSLVLTVCGLPPGR